MSIKSFRLHAFVAGVQKVDFCEMPEESIKQMSKRKKSYIAYRRPR